ncbi:hypothetical protein LSCM1_04549 [Leishmania martiniquensis]|uniref:Uncharacterized protein n=1 Tax=Leishmania martiniquensis TaxID=1580590 RepID=A0A836H2A4_9TRYP|nr:hypothetical protein LSCM1_04549 [Leishmania martiniquensis]
MSFFANPLAEEEEVVVPPDYPLEQYDELKREDDFNELLVRSTKLEARQSGGEDGVPADPELEACLCQTRKLRASLESSWQRMSELHRDMARKGNSSYTVGTPGLSASASSSIAALESAVAQMQHHVTQRERLGLQLRALVEREAARISSTAPRAVATANAPVACDHDSSSITRGPEAISSLPSPDVIAGRAAGAARALEALLPSMSMEEAALASAAVQQLAYGLQSWSTLARRYDALRVTVEANSQEQAEAHRAAEAFARWVAEKQLACGEAAASPAPSAVTVAPFDVATAELLNKELTEENGRLEAALARLFSLQQLNKAPPDVFAGSAVVQYVALTAYARDLEEEVDRLGRAVLYLRGVLTGPLAREPRGALDASLADAVPTPPSTCHEDGERLARRLSRIHALEQELRSQQASCSDTDTASDAVDTIVSFGLGQLLEVHNACVHAMALLSTYFEKQSGHAAFLSHAVRGGGAVENATVERVLDVQLPDAEVVRQYCVDMHVMSADLAATLKVIVDKASIAATADLARWHAVRSLLTELLQPNLATVPDVYAEFSAMLAAYADAKTPSAAAASSASAATTQVHADLDWATAVLAEEATSFAVEKEAQRELIKAFWAAQQTEAAKKMAWLEKQPNAPLLKQLCDVERETDQLRQQVASVQEASENASALLDTLAELQRRNAEEERLNATLRAELTELETARRELKEQRDALLSSISQG